MAGGSGSKASRRKYPRVELKAKARLWLADDGRKFEATLPVRDVSLGGIFFESTFFLKVGQILEVELSLPNEKRPVRAKGKVVRVESIEGAGRPKSGFAVRFDEYRDAGDVVLANHFLAPVLRSFLEEYERKQKLALSRENRDQVIDILAAWELGKVGRLGPIWPEEP